MRIAISLLDFEPGNSGGIETYTRDLIDALQDIDKENKYFVLLNIRNRGALRVRADNFEVVYADQASFTFAKKLLRKLRIFDSPPSRSIRGTILRLKLDIIHFPLQIIPKYLTDLPGTKKIITIVDIQHEYFPHFFTQEDLKFRRSSYLRSINAADKVISISNFTKITLLKHYPLTPDKVSTVHLSFNGKIFNKESTSVANKYGRYFYYPAATWAHKNHEGLLKAFSKITKKYPDCGLVLTGLQKQKSENIFKMIESLNLSQKVHILGYIDRNQQAGLYKNAVGLIFPSLFEGFGIPLLEAMAVGCPVAASNVTSIPEVGGDAALYFDPSKPGKIAEAMAALIEDPDLRQKLISAGFKRAAYFTNTAMATATLKLYLNLGENK